MPERREAVIISACRTPTGKFQGSLKGFTATQLGALVVGEAVKRAGVKPEEVDEVIMGCVIQAGLGQNPARQAALKGRIPFGVSAGTGEKGCGPGANAAIRAGKFKDEILPVEIKQKKGDHVVFDTDEPVREDTSLDALARLKPAFRKDGTVT